MSTTEFYVALTVAALCLVIGLINPAFFRVQNLFDILRSMVEMGILALGFFVVLASGGIDVSFGAIALFSMYATVKTLTGMQYEGGLFLPFLMGGTIGLLLGFVNAFFISLFRLPTLIVTLGTSSVIRGAMLVFLGVKIITVLPPSMYQFGITNLAHAATAQGTTIGLAASVLALAAASILVWALMRYTMIGRGVFAIGGDAVAARRAGFNLRSIYLFVYGLSGALAGVTGILHASAVRNANPYDFIDVELSVIAAVVLGGARITGGHGSVIGTLLGVALVVVMNNSLILMGVSSYWQRVVIGLLILIGTGVAAYQGKRQSRVSLTDV